MRRFLAVSFVFLALLAVSSADAFELSFRNGPAINLKDWPVSPQYKLGINFAATSKGAASGFYSSTSMDISMLKDTTIIWLTPEFQYDIKLGALPLYIYPKLGLDMFFAWWPANLKSFGFGLKAAIGAKFDIIKQIFIWAEPFGMNIIFAQYVWGGGGGTLGFLQDGEWSTHTCMTYDMMFGVGFRL